MNKTIKIILMIAGVGLLLYGGYIMMNPETEVSLGSLEIASQDNTNAYITIGLGIVALLAGALPKK
ncbi:hypothetical protein [Tenacibaculum geojense]|uniref:Arginyl-tRNA synthetase n=1 Tax=Tenacibaculum geojense TaxID=915352 RepID=A0ABW3JMW2_9FLAO